MGERVFFWVCVGAWFVWVDYLLKGWGMGWGWLAERVLSVCLFGFPNALGVLRYLTLVLIHETILLSDRANVSTDRKGIYIMSESKAPEGKSVPKLVKAYKLLVTTGDQGVRDWYRLALGTTVRDFEATIVEAKKAGEVRGITKNSAKFLPVIVRAFDIAGSDKVSVVDICKVAETAQRALKADGALALAGLVTDWDDFEAKAEKALEDKPKRNNVGAGRKAGEVTELLNADGVILKALEALQELDDLTITNFDAVDALVKLVNASVANSRKLLAQSVERHPAKGIVTPVKGGAVLDIDEMMKRVEKASA